MALRKACYVRMVIMLLHGAEVKLQASLFVPLPCYKALHTRYHFLAFFQWIHKSLTLCVSQSFLDWFGEHDQQSVLLSSCSQQNGLGHTLVSFPDPPRKAERGSGVLSDNSCHMGRAVLRKECHFLYPELEFLTPQSIRTTTQPGFQKLETAAKLHGG